VLGGTSISEDWAEYVDVDNLDDLGDFGARDRANLYQSRFYYDQ
jgi:hypothetical protein